MTVKARFWRMYDSQAHGTCTTVKVMPHVWQGIVERIGYMYNSQGNILALDIYCTTRPARCVVQGRPSHMCHSQMWHMYDNQMWHMYDRQGQIMAHASQSNVAHVDSQDQMAHV